MLSAMPPSGPYKFSENILPPLASFYREQQLIQQLPLPLSPITPDSPESHRSISPSESVPSANNYRGLMTTSSSTDQSSSRSDSSRDHQESSAPRSGLDALTMAAVAVSSPANTAPVSAVSPRPVLPSIRSLDPSLETYTGSNGSHGSSKGNGDMNIINNSNSTVNSSVSANATTSSTSFPSPVSSSSLSSPNLSDSAPQLPHLANVLGNSYWSRIHTIVPVSGAMSLANLDNPTPATPPINAPVNYAPTTSSNRKKRQCPQCHGWFSNLATHVSIHLADNSRPHTCDVCGRGFARPNDLFRHQKSHRGDAPFNCPLFIKNSSPHDSFGNLEPSCHQSGGFSRCDTYKNHLKAMHFEYPAGTKKRDRIGMPGKCKACGMSFNNADEWITEHIETARCEGVKRVAEMRE